MSHDNARGAARRTPSARGPMSTSQIPARLLRGATKSSFAASEPGSFRLRRTFKRPKGKVRKATQVHAHPCCRLEAQARACLKTRGRIQDREPERSGSSRGRSCCAMVRMSKANRQDKATTSSSTSERSASRAGATKASANRSSKVLLVLWSHSRTRSRRSKPTLHGAQVLNPKSRAIRIIKWRAAPGGGACPSCVVVLQRRLRHDASNLLSTQRTWWEQKLQHAARTVRSCEPHQPYSATQQAQWQRPRSRSGGGRKPSDQAGPRESS